MTNSKNSYKVVFFDFSQFSFDKLYKDNEKLYVNLVKTTKEEIYEDFNLLRNCLGEFKCFISIKDDNLKEKFLLDIKKEFEEIENFNLDNYDKYLTPYLVKSNEDGELMYFSVEIEVL